ncbi:MAG: complement resistance protein TraT [Nitrospira sp.]|nr:complement resistance protein TraT [Nitrospira sp.]
MRSMMGLPSFTVGRVVVVGFGLVFLAGCAASQTMISKRHLDVQTKMSETIFLDPVGPDKKVIFVEVRNTSDKDNFDIAAPIMDAIAKRGYRITQNPDEAHFRLQANVLSVAKTDPTAAQQALMGGYGGPLMSAVGGAAAGAAIGGLAGGTYGAAGIGAAAGGLAFAGAEVVAGALVKDVTFMVVTDVQVVEKAPEGVIIRQDNQQNLKQGVGGSQQQTSSEVTKHKKYRTRVVSTANKANLDYEEAAPALTQGLTKSLAGLF